MEAVVPGLWVVFMLVILALVFDFMNGFHDAANSIATVVSTGVLKPFHAVAFAAFFNCVAFFVFTHSVAATIGKGVIDPGVVDLHVVFGALIGAIVWNVVTWRWGIPSSSSHALIGGIIGAGVARSGTEVLIGSNVAIRAKSSSSTTCVLDDCRIHKAALHCSGAYQWLSGEAQPSLL